jgi:hypothetical protein
MTCNLHIAIIAAIQMNDTMRIKTRPILYWLPVPVIIATSWCNFVMGYLPFRYFSITIIVVLQVSNTIRCRTRTILLDFRWWRCSFNQTFSCKIDKIIIYTGLVVWCLTQLSTIVQLYRGGQFYWLRKPEYTESWPWQLPLQQKTLVYTIKPFR